MKILKIRKKNHKKIIQQAAVILEQGGLIIYPTETCYGVGVDATNPQAVQKLLNYKGKRGGKAISAAVADKKMAKKYVAINQTADNLYDNFLPGPLTVVSRSKGKVVTQLESENKTLGIRIPHYPLILQLIKVLGKPITATSANTSNKPQPYSIEKLLKNTSQKSQKMIDLILDGGQLPYCPVSSVVDTTLNEPRLLRQGEITIDECQDRVFTSASERETKNIAQQIFNKFKKQLKSKALIFALQGELGAGKTQFTKGLAKALGIKTNISSPTFILMKEYPYSLQLISRRAGSASGRKGTLFHLDTWRMEKGEELLDLGLKAMLKRGNLVAIEWLEKVKDYLEKISKQKNVKLVWITIDYLSQNKRRIKYRESKLT
jgi:L-threonylcarbamoyladenylate synthase